ncbi:MAG: hypothetical protein KIS62_01305 [Ramlibacter sp.]|nr:hypothetical protein [Ramlibacter sp.]
MAEQQSPLDVIAEEARAVAQFFGVAACDVAAQMLVRRVASRLGGKEIYFPAGKFKKAIEHAEVCRLFNGTNYDEVAKVMGMSTRQVRRIVAKYRRSKK